MNDYFARKLGEVLAFANVGLDTLAKGQSAFENVLGDGHQGHIGNVRKNLEQQQKEIERIAKDKNFTETVMAKAEKTGEKLRQMRDLYIGDSWDDPAELLEWSGFFEGAALVHWSFIEGIAETHNVPDLQKLAKNATEFHQGLLENYAKALKKIGSS